MTTKNTATTETVREKFAKAHIDQAVLHEITQIAFGNGGHDGGGEPIEPDGTETQVPGEFLKKSIESSEYEDLATAKIIGELDYNEGNGEEVSACGLYDANDDLVGLKTFYPINKDDEMKIKVTWKEKF